MNIKIIQAVAIAVVVGFLSGAWFGWSYRGDHDAAKQVDELALIAKEHQKQMEAEIAKALETERKLEASRVKSKVHKKEIKKYVADKKDDPICFDDAAVRLWNDSSAGSTTTDTGKLFNKMPTIKFFGREIEKSDPFAARR